ncbi:MAG: AAA family ATPase [Phycisphaerae bacterium]|nr:AAA family ATPase [Phycisphaerae bacterium]
MRRSIRVIVFNADEEYSATLRAELLVVPGVQIVAEVDDPSLIEQAVKQFPAEVVIVHLDPVPNLTFPVAAAVASGHPDLAVFVISENTDSQYILASMRAGIREFLTKPLDTNLVKESMEKILAQSASSVQLGTMISIMGTIGGAGASTLATNLAVELAKMTKQEPVILVDLDFRFGQQGTMLDLQSGYTIADLCDTPEQLDESMIEKAIIKHANGVHLLARPNHFFQADQITAAHCISVLSTLQQMYEYVIIDGPTRSDAGGMSVLDLADINILVMQLLLTSVHNTRRILEALRENGYNLERFRLVCNRVGCDCSHLGIENIEETLHMKFFHQIPDDWKSVSVAINMGVPLAESAPKSQPRLAIQELAKRIANPQEETKAEPAKTGGRLLSRIFNSA